MTRGYRTPGGPWIRPNPTTPGTCFVYRSGMRSNYSTAKVLPPSPGSSNGMPVGYSAGSTRSTRKTPPRPRITVASAIPKGPRAEAMVDQLSQLGVDRLIPLRAQYSVAVPKTVKIEKFARLTVESAKQCRRPWLMHVEAVQTPSQTWSDDGYDLKLIASPDGDRWSALADRLRGSQDVLVLIGPEGGWSPGELASAREAGCMRWWIAPHVLRIEAAAAAAAAILRYASMA